MSFTKLSWESGLPRTVLVIKKINDKSIVPDFVTLIDWLINTEHLNVVVESKVLKEKTLRTNSTFYNLKEDLLMLNKKNIDSVDLIMTLGGDGTLLYTASLFVGPMPPVVPFYHGSLGFLTPHKFQNYQEIVSNVISGKSDLTVRSRLTCDLSDDGMEKTLVMNEVVISRNPSASMSSIDLHMDGQFVTSFLGDGLMLSTSTGSTAYAASVGSSLVHPSVDGILVVPINSHSLSSRPVLVPAGVELRVSVSPSNRDDSVQCSFDGRGQKQLNKGQSLTITTSDHHVPCVAAKDPIVRAGHFLVMES